jgi:putative transcriptional regulator
MSTSAKLVSVSNHPNRGGARWNKASATPTPSQIKRAREAAGLTLEQAGALVHTSLRTWQNWETAADEDNHRRMHPATWELFRVKVNAKRLLEEREISPSTLRELELYLPDPD